MSASKTTGPDSVFSEVGLLLGEQGLKIVQRVLQAADQWVAGREWLRVGAILFVYGAILSLAFFLAYELRWDFEVPDDFVSQFRVLLLPIVVCKLALLHSFGQFRSILSYFGLADFGGVLVAMLTVSGLMLGLWYGSEITAAPPRGVIMMDFTLSVAGISAFRLSLRIARSWTQSGPVRPGREERRVAIIGSGDVGEALAKDLLQRRGNGVTPVLFVDNDPRRIGRTIHGLPVIGPLSELGRLAPLVRINELVITETTLPPKQMKEIVELGKTVGASTRVIPSFTQLASGEVRVARSRPVVIEDLLGRLPVNLSSDHISQMLSDRVVMVTGAGGSIGSELCRQVLSHRPRRLILVERSEFMLFELEQELLSQTPGDRLEPVVLDVTNESGVRAILALLRPQIIFHAAAHKHVPMMERQPSEALKNNAIGTAKLMRLASDFGVERFILISTDKAINPTSVMGCSKRLAEKTLQAQQRAAGNRTQFLAVRFGNVLGSSGSVIPTFRRQIEQGGPVTVTHRDMTRYFMTIPEAVGLVLQTATLGQGGEIFVLDMSEPVKIYDMARQMIELSGYRPDVDIEIAITGLRPGEKLFEELRHTDETHGATAHPRIFKLLNQDAPGDLAAWLANLEAAAAQTDPADVKRSMKQLVPEYTPFAD